MSRQRKDTFFEPHADAGITERLIAAIEAGVVTETTKSRLVELEAERANIEKGITKEKIATPHLDRDQVVFFLERFRDADMGEDKHRERLVKTFLNSVFLYDDPDDPKKGKLVLCMNYTDEYGQLGKITLPIMENAVFHGGGGCSSFAPSSAPKGSPVVSIATGSFFMLVSEPISFCLPITDLLVLTLTLAGRIAKR
ncbi:MAG: hypothetical protein FWG32_01235 [Oscillospiraceae bacterium]|nr:hypothetical protein [Oscillospiraceae bacterium]